ncbi:hypothetical protein BJX68DRAFT_60365 [Aspergillus pseudodeflectus]|uniref:Uncharacterized protein n=1 Tax=Aspergillus pseudodeflectus TaxID=176178 RepID=A0ABR4KIQ5_9EURO
MVLAYSLFYAGLDCNLFAGGPLRLCLLCFTSIRLTWPWLSLVASWITCALPDALYIAHRASVVDKSIGRNPHPLNK